MNNAQLWLLIVIANVFTLGLPYPPDSNVPEWLEFLMTIFQIAISLFGALRIWSELE